MSFIWKIRSFINDSGKTLNTQFDLNKNLYKRAIKKRFAYFINDIILIMFK